MLQITEKSLVQMPSGMAREETWGWWAGVHAYGDMVAEWQELCQADEHMLREGDSRH